MYISYIYNSKLNSNKQPTNFRAYTKTFSYSVWLQFYRQPSQGRQEISQVHNIDCFFSYDPRNKNIIAIYIYIYL